jgi:hypothetical protein
MALFWASDALPGCHGCRQTIRRASLSTEKGSARFGLELLSPDPPAAPAPFCQPQSAGREFPQHPAFLSTAE